MKVQNHLALAGLLLSNVNAIDILQNRVRETLHEIDALEDLARHNDMAPEVLRGQSQRGLRPIQQLQQRANRNAIGPLMEVIYEDFAEKLGAISF